MMRFFLAFVHKFWYDWGIVKKYNEKLTFEIVDKRFIDQGRTDIKLCEDEYSGWKSKSKFFDLIENDYFWAVPKNVYNQLSCHPKRAVKNRSKTNSEKYGNNCSLHGSKIKEKTKKTNLERYGTENAFQSILIKEKIKNTMLEKYNVENISQLDSIKEIKRLAKSDKYIEDTGEHLKNWIEKNKNLCPSYTSLVVFFKDRKIYSNELELYFDNWKNNKTSLEAIGEQIFESVHFNKKPEVIQKNYRPDFKLSETVYVNVDGLYWHSVEQKDKNYHFEMRKEFEKNNLRLFQFHENEIKDKSEIVKSIIDNSNNKTTRKIFARKCDVKTVEQKEANEFLRKNHLMGSTTARHVGLYYEKNLVALMSFKEIKDICKIERFCSLINSSVVGGFGKLLKHIESNLLKPSTTEVHNWVDLRYGTGKHLESKGFKLIKETLGWKWTDYKDTFNRLHCRANMDQRKLTEKQHSEELNLVKIYDAGQRLYLKKL